MKKVKITETVLRDGQQSLIATRMPYSDFADVLETLDKAGYHSLECWGGATFDSCLRYLNEDPWERLRNIRDKVKNTKLQMLLRGKNLLGYKHYSDDVVRRFIAKSVDNGMDIFRTFDALNDFNNIKLVVEETIKRGAHAQGAICFSLSPVHSIEKFTKMGVELENMGVHSICVKDMAGIMGPKDAFDLVTALKATVKVPVIVHTHATSGLAPITYLKAVEAGCDGIDTAISSFSGGTSQPATETLAYSLKELGYDIDLKMDVLQEINNFFKPLKEKYLASGLMDPFVLGTEIDTLTYQVPGGMLSNLVAQLKAQNSIELLQKVLEEVPSVRKDLGYPPLVTPMSQIVGAQSASNVLAGERYKNVSKEVKSYLRGEYGQAPGEINKELQKKILGEEAASENAAGLDYETAQKEIGNLAQSEEDVLSYISFPQVAEKFFNYREEQKSRKVTYSIQKK